MRSPTHRQWTGIVLVAAVLPTLTATVWPMLTFLWGLYPDDLPTGRIFFGAGLSAVLVMAVALILIGARRRTSFWLWWLIIIAWMAAIGAVAAMVLVIWLVLGSPGLNPPSELSPRAMDAIATRAFAVVAGLGGVALLVIAYRRQRTTENGDQREVTKLFTERFTTAVSQLGDNQPAIRLGGVHALAHLADDAPERRDDLIQMVIDVLCAYLRMPYDPAPDPLPKNANRERREEHRARSLNFASIREVRHTIIRVIGDHLRENTRWRDKDYDFTGVIFDGGNLHDAIFSGGRISFIDSTFSRGNFYFQDATFSGADVLFVRTKFLDGAVNFIKATFSGGTVSFEEAEFTNCATFFDGAKFIGSSISFVEAKFHGGQTTFCASHFGESEVLFSRASFLGGKVRFTEAGTNPQLKKTGNFPKGLKEAVGASKPGVVTLPESWL